MRRGCKIHSHQRGQVSLLSVVCSEIFGWEGRLSKEIKIYFRKERAAWVKMARRDRVEVRVVGVLGMKR